MDISSFGPLVGSLIRAGAPAIGGVLSLALTPVAGPFAGMIGGAVTDIMPRIADALGAPPDATPNQLASVINADPAAAQNKLAALEEEHSSTLATLKQNQDFQLANQAQQTAVDVVEAQSPSFFVAGARPMIMWGLGGLMMLSYTLPFPLWFLTWMGGHPPPPPSLDPQAMYLLSALLGLTVVARSVEKATGVPTVSVAPGAATARVAAKVAKLAR